MNRSAGIDRCLLQALALAAAVLPAGPAAAQGRGELLYNTHCIACHSTQMHWRDNKQAVDWPTLLAQVSQWQAQARLNWTADDVEQVARFLNDGIYRFKAPPRRLGLAGAAHRVAEAPQAPQAR